MYSQRKIDAALLGRELVFSTSRSSGPGGQNVNKVNTRVTVRWDIATSTVLTPEEKEILLNKLSTKLSTDQVLIVSAQETRSQLHNKTEVILKLESIISKAFEKRKKRKATKPTKQAVKKRIESKKQHAEKKQWRKKL
ncbi:MAG TPA: alternative ribosome rescue aminoacyl-tRNA hydrolase ArfB [Ohtaekwangia sp.]|nr:alternative ribosome rescue aminoacyl-tRNA hydrolase ArfB [Ohtaekwangia sp.]